ncbi:UDP-N-acetylglucosamine--dolichyl-phosphate N-acetylglucosaminephosphotransferase [Candidatus Caldarchaeum subterraneum]|uniref:Glycosyl transferase family protein n=2 Tax=Caldiarchaeum subterraneum TaxID=311458 RepID=E6N435_CALS0|nr:glycosyl transferase family protein [Candidatus Caldarchaeum subterraneum]BAJ47054.1 UDP-N-acetylglucosamine--dolichyl-phosphate N-acetylglucosaminephosphotransferase [Candidatus Caldarchaeum subterraneum]BAJ49886.1 UDP-N-acetylglucosamine--dolichyl-phosphate N-acetylglucosaminephosphotransferase [Candidatus Caldarchaeum subterraneum]
MFQTAIVAAAAAAATAFVMLPVSMWLSRRSGAMGLDVHKPNPYPVPKLGGLAIVAGLAAGALVCWVFTSSSILAPFVGSLAVAALIGLWEDFREINPVLKPVLLVVAGVPVVAAGVYSPDPVLPFVGPTRLTILYPLLVLLGFSIVCNAVNSLDVLNGSMAATSLTAILPLTIIAYLEKKAEIFSLCLVTAVVLLVFLSKNIYPAKTFAGNVGSLAVGAVIAYVAIVGRMEVAAIVALLPHIMNEFHIIYSLGGLRSGKKAPTRPTIINSGVITANVDRKAPVTVVRLLTAGEKLTEPAVVWRLFLLCLYSAVLSLLTYFLFIRRWLP